MSKYQRQLATWQRIEARLSTFRRNNESGQYVETDEERRQSRRYDGIQRGARGRGTIGQYV